MTKTTGPSIAEVTITGDFIKKRYDTSIEIDQEMRAFLDETTKSSPNYSIFGYNCNNYVNSVIEILNDIIEEASESKPSIEATEVRSNEALIKEGIICPEPEKYESCIK